MADAGTVTATEQTGVSHPVKKVTFAWTSSAGGAADKQTTNLYSGEVLRVVTVPGTGGVQPSAYSFTLLDDDGADVCFGNGATRSTTATEQIAAADLGIVAGSKLFLHVTGAGSAKAGSVFVYIR
jgi:hypothetical protein